MKNSEELAERLLDLEVRLSDWQAKANAAFAEKFDFNSIPPGGFDEAHRAAGEYAETVAGPGPREDVVDVLADLADRYIAADGERRGELRAVLREHDAVWAAVTAFVDVAGDRLEASSEARWVARAAAALAMAHEFPDARDTLCALSRLCVKAQAVGVDPASPLTRAAFMAEPAAGDASIARSILLRLARPGQAEEILREP